MRKTVFRYFFDFFDGQRIWLNSMAKRGYRLQKCWNMAYTFEECQPDEYEYAVEYVGAQSYSRAKDYRGYLEGMGFRTFTKNINLNISLGKVRWRPYAKGMGQIAASPGGFNKELLILEKKKDGEPFELHTDLKDKINTYKTIRCTYAWAVLLLLCMIVMTFIPGFSSVPEHVLWVLRIIIAIIALLFLIPTVKYFTLAGQLKKESRTFE